MIESSVTIALARIVAKDGRLDNFEVRAYFDGSNETKWSDFQTVIAEGLPFLVRLRPEIVGIDLDTTVGIQQAQEIARRAKIEDRAVIVASGGEGRAHLFTRATKNERTKIAAIIEQIKAEDPTHNKIEIRQDIRPPKAPHRQGKPVEIVGITDAEAINRLATDHTLERLAEALQAKEYRFKTLFFIACDYVRRNLSEAQYIEDVLSNPIGSKALQRKDPAGFLREAYQKARQAVASSTSSNRPQIEAWESEARRKAILSGNRNLLTTIKEIAEIAKRSNKTELTIGTREILTCTHSTAQRHLSKLQALGLLATTKEANKAQMRSTTYRLKCEQNATYRDLSLGGCLPCMSQNIRIYEALHRKQAAYRVLEIIAANKGITAREIAQALNYPQVRSVQLQLKFLIGLGVIESYGNHYKVARVDDQHLEDIAAQRGTIGCIEKRKAQYAKDRYQYAASVAAYQELRKARAQQREAKRQAQRNAPRSSSVKQDPWQPSDWLIPTVRPTPTGGYAYTSP